MRTASILYLYDVNKDNQTEKHSIMEMSKQQKKGFSFLNQKTIDQRNEFYKRTIAFETKQLKNSLKNAQEGNVSYGWSKEEAIKSATRALDLVGIKSLTWLKDAESYYNSKLLQVVSKLEQFGMLEEGIMLDAYDVENTEMLGMNFYIKAWDSKIGDYAGRAFMRFVPVDGMEKVFHYRLICTFKGEKKVEATIVEVEPTQTKKEQIMTLFNAGKSTKDIQLSIGGNISYIRTIIRNNK